MLVVIPIHQEIFLKNSIKNFERQNYNDKELLFVFNGELLNYKSKYKSVCINTNNIAKIRNCGLNYARKHNYSVVSFFDSDDIYYENYLSEAMEKLNEGYQMVGKINWRFVKDADFSNIYEASGYTESGLIHGPTMTLNVSDINFDEQFHSLAEDIDFIKKHKNIGYTSVNNWVYNARGDSIQSRNFSVLLEQIKMYATLSKSINVKIKCNDEIIWRYGEGFDPEVIKPYNS